MSVDWDRQPLGQEPDATIAKRLGHDWRRVKLERERRKIPKFRPAGSEVRLPPPGAPRHHRGKKALEDPLEPARALRTPIVLVAARAPLGLARWCPGCEENFMAAYESQICCSPGCRRVAELAGTLPLHPAAARARAVPPTPGARPLPSYKKHPLGPPGKGER